MATSFPVTVAASRSINHVREGRRALPMWRGFGLRSVPPAGAAGDRRVHHFMPGIAPRFATGGAAILTRDDGLDRRLSVPFGVGLGLTTDELGLLLEAPNPYRVARRSRSHNGGGVALITRGGLKRSTP